MSLLALAAGLVRLATVVASGGFRVTMGYDDGVYFAATNAFLQGRVPYAEFVLVHPPGIMLFAAVPVWLSHLAGLDDASTLVAIRWVFLGLGSLNTVLVFVAGRHLSRVAGVTAAALYAVWLPVVREERTILLEPLVALGVLAALGLVPPVSNRASDRIWRPVLAGILGGLAACTKLWALAPLGVIVIALLLARRWRILMAYVAAVAATSMAIVLPFAARAGGAMWRNVVLGQSGRPDNGDSRWDRVAQIIYDGVPLHGRAQHVLGAHAFLVLVVIVLIGIAAVVAVRLPVARVWVALLAVQAVVLLLVPTFFIGYPSFVAPAGVLVIGAAFHLAWHARITAGRPARVLLSAAVAIAFAVLGWLASTARIGWPVETAIMQATGGARCVATDQPAVLAVTNTLSSTLHNGCQLPVDFYGASYAMPKAPTQRNAGRRGSDDFQAFATDYFDSADVVILGPGRKGSLTPRTLQHLALRPHVTAGQWLITRR